MLNSSREKSNIRISKSVYCVSYIFKTKHDNYNFYVCTITYKSYFNLNIRNIDNKDQGFIFMLYVSEFHLNKFISSNFFASK